MPRRSFLIVLLMLVCYGYTLPRWADWNQNSRFALVRALAEDGSVRIDRYIESTGDYAVYKGHAYSDKAPGPALLGVPVHALVWRAAQLRPVYMHLELLARQSAMAGTLRPEGAGITPVRLMLAFSHYLITLTVVALLAAIAVAALDWLLQRWFRPAPALLGALGYGLATPFATYAGNYYSHALVAALLICAWALIVRGSEVPARQPRLLLASGFLLGWATISEYPAVLPCIALGCYVMHRCGWRSAVWLVAGGLPALVALIIYDLVAFGTPWPVGYAHSALWQEQHHTGFISLTYPHVEAMWGLLASRFRGLFLRSPWLLLAIPGAVAWWCSGRRRSELLVAVGSALSLWLLYSASRMWWGGFGAGPRYLVPALPFFTVPAVWWLDHIWHRPFWRRLTIAIVMVSLLLVWSEGLASQAFPPDTIPDPWRDYTLLAWRRGDIARNIGMAIGLRGVFSVVPLLFVAAVLTGLILRAPTRHGVQTLGPQPALR